SMAGRVPLIGPWVVEVLLGAPVIGGAALSRFFALHVFVVPGLLLLFLVLHLWLVLKKGVSEPPVPGRPVDPKTYDELYHEEVKKGVPFLGPAMWKDAFFSALAVIVVVVLAAAWSPRMTAWSGDAVPEDMVRRSSPLQLQGAVVFQNKNCRNCHALGGKGGARGPDLSEVGVRLPRNKLFEQVSNGTPGGGNMPAYGKQVNEAQMTALIEFLVSCRKPGRPPAQTPDTRP